MAASESSRALCAPTVAGLASALCCQPFSDTSGPGFCILGKNLSLGSTVEQGIRYLTSVLHDVKTLFPGRVPKEA